MELTDIDENYVTQGTCGKCGGISHQKLDPIFDNIRVGCADGQLRPKLRKGVYPYEYMNDCETFKENHLAPIRMFYSKLNLLGISEHN